MAGDTTTGIVMEVFLWVGELMSAVGRGLLAGLAGTAAMTLVQLMEMKLTGRAPSATPAEAAGKLLGVQPRGPKEKVRFANIVHWAYGTTWGTVRGILGFAGLVSWVATLVHFAAVWVSALVMLPALDAAPPVSKWGARVIALDILYHAVYAAVAGFAYEFITR